MAGYTRQSVADIVPTAVVRAAPINAEYNKLRDAFTHSTTGTTGHKHDGSSDEGSYVPLIADLDGLNKIVVDTTNNRHGVFVEVSSAAVEQVRFADGVIIPVTDNDIDLGSSSAEFKNLWLDGTANVDTLQVDENATVSGNISVTGTSTFTGAMSVGSITATGTATLATVDINAGAIDGTIIGASSAAAGSFTTITTSGQATLASADINGGTVDGAVIGGTSASAITGTTITANTGFVGSLTGDVTGNVTGNLTGDVTGNVVGNVTGNVTAATGSSSFNDVVINGTLNMNAVTTATITNLTTPVNTGDAATKGYVDTSISDLIAAAPATLDTLNELAAALGDDANFATTVTDSIATKLALAGGTMTGAIAMGTNKITGMGDPTANQDAATKYYVDTQDATKLSLSGGTMTGTLDMGANKITTTYTPTNNADLTTKVYVDAILGSATAAATSAANAATSETNAATSETNAANSASAAAASYDAFDDRYLGSKSSAPTVDNDGNALLTGALYWNSVEEQLYVWSGSTWTQSAFTASGFLTAANNLSDLIDAATARTNLGVAIGTDVQAYDATILTSSDIGTSVQAYDATIVVDADIGVTVQAYDADTAKTDVVQTFTANQTVSAEFKATSYNETYAAVTSTTNATTVNCEAGNTFSHTLTENTTFTFSNPPATGTAYSFSLEIIQDASASGFTVTWPTSVDWPSATAPTLTATASAVDVFVFYTRDGGTTFQGFIAGQAQG